MSARDMQDKIDDVAVRTFGEPMDLLLEWFTWWAGDDAAPVKMPDSLHTRTACLLALSGHRQRVDEIMNRDDLVVQASPPQDEQTGECGECGVSLMWGGMRWLPHTQEYHDGVRRRLMIAALFGLYRHVAREIGHCVTIRFTQTYSWAQCSCKWEGALQPASSHARITGQDHLTVEGRKRLSWWRAQQQGIKDLSAAERL